MMSNPAASGSFKMLILLDRLTPTDAPYHIQETRLGMLMGKRTFIRLGEAGEPLIKQVIEYTR